MMRTLFVVVLSALALAACQRDESKSAPKTGATPPTSSAPAPATPPSTPPSGGMSKDAPKK